MCSVFTLLMKLYLACIIGFELDNITYTRLFQKQNFCLDRNFDFFLSSGDPPKFLSKQKANFFCRTILGQEGRPKFDRKKIKWAILVPIFFLINILIPFALQSTL